MMQIIRAGLRRKRRERNIPSSDSRGSITATQRGIEQRFHLRVGELRPAAMCVDRQFCVVQPQLLRAELINSGAQPDNLRGRQETVPTGDDQVDVCGQTTCKSAQEGRHDR